MTWRQRLAQHARPRRRRFLHLVVRLTLTALCLTLVAAPFPIAFVMQHRAELFGPQHEPPAVQLPAGASERYRSAAAAASEEPHTAPIILSYHDIRPAGGDEPYVVSPSDFAEQMAMLDKAGYETLTADQFLRYTKGGSVPSDAVLITFDDGTQGLYTYADKILAKHGFHAVSFLITGRVSRDQDYYLNWAQVERMRDSGRWDFGSHTSNLHSRVPVAADGDRGSPLTNRRWLASRGERESMQAFRQRVRRDLTRSIESMTAHGLPRPRLFAYPFSEEATGSGDARAGRAAHQIIDDLFVASMTNDSSPTAISRRAIASGVLPRLEVFADTSAAELFTQMQGMATVPVTDEKSLRDVANWVDYGGDPADVDINRGSLIFPDNKDTYAYAAYAPRRTADWEDYTFTTRVTRLQSSDSATATVSARKGTPSELTVNVSDDTLSIYVGRDEEGEQRRQVYETELLPSDSHDVAVEVRRGSTSVRVDGIEYYSAPAEQTPRNNGGIAVASNRGSVDKPYVGFADITVRKGDR